MIVLRRCHTFGNIIPSFRRDAEAHRGLVPVSVERPDNPNRGLSVLVFSYQGRFSVA